MNELIPMIEKPSRIKNTSSHTSNTYTIKLWEDIAEPFEYAEEIDLITSATEHDTIVLDICSGGGLADTAMLFNRALRATQAHTVAVFGPTTASAAGVIALSCDDFILDETSSLMIHTSSYSYGGKDTDIYEHANFARIQLKTFYEQVFSGFLSEDELSDVIKGTPLYFAAKDIEERLGRMSEYRQQQYEQDGEEESVEAPVSLQDMFKNAVREVMEEFNTKTPEYTVSSHVEPSEAHAMELHNFDKHNKYIMDELEYRGVDNAYDEDESK